MNPNLTIPAKHFFLSAIYGLKRAGKYIYIGQSIEVFQRVKHLRRFDLLVDDMIDLWFCGAGELDQLERNMIQIHNPEFNKKKYNNLPKTKRESAGLMEYKRQELARRMKFGRRVSRVHK